MIKDIATSQGKRFNENDFDSTFLLIDRDASGKIDKDEMRNFIKSMLEL